MGKTTSLRGVVVDWREVDTVEVRYWETVLRMKKFILSNRDEESR